MAAPDQPRCHRGAARIFEHGEPRAIGAALPLSDIGAALDRRAWCVPRMDRIVRLAADQESRNARRQPGHRVSDRRRGAAAPRARRRRAPCGRDEAPFGTAVIVLSRLPQNRDGAGGNSHGDRDSETAAGVSALLQDFEAAARRYQHRAAAIALNTDRSGKIRQCAVCVRWRRRDACQNRRSGKRRSWIKRGTQALWTRSSGYSTAR